MVARCLLVVEEEGEDRGDDAEEEEEAAEGVVSADVVTCCCARVVAPLNVDAPPPHHVKPLPWRTHASSVANRESLVLLHNESPVGLGGVKQPSQSPHEEDGSACVVVGAAITAPISSNSCAMKAPPQHQHSGEEKKLFQ